MMELVVLFLIYLILIASSIFIVRIVNLNHSENSFTNLVRILASLMAFQCLLMYMDIFMPIELLYGPIHLSLYRINRQKFPDKYLYYQFLPFLLLGLFYLVFCYGMQSGSTWGPSLSIYHPIHMITTLLSIFFYGIYLWSRKTSADYKGKQLQLVLQLATIPMAIGIFVAIFALVFLGILDTELVGFNARYPIYGLLLLSIFKMSLYLRTTDQQESECFEHPLASEESENTGFHSDEQIFKAYAVKVSKVIDGEKKYLDVSLSLDDLAIATEIPTHHLTLLFNVYFGKSFYQYIAEKRIGEAITRMNENDNFTFESIAYDCGFSARSSFNRSFKKLVGMTPSEYREQRIAGLQS